MIGGQLLPADIDVRRPLRSLRDSLNPLSVPHKSVFIKCLIQGKCVCVCSTQRRGASCDDSTSILNPCRGLNGCLQDDSPPLAATYCDVPLAALLLRPLLFLSAFVYAFVCCCFFSFTCWRARVCTNMCFSLIRTCSGCRSLFI